jgi:hypothetical protein
MQLYAGPTPHFVRDSFQNAIADKLALAFEQYHRYRPPQSEVQSWRNSLRAMSQALQDGDLERTNVVLEYQLPLTSRRLDCMVLGRSPERGPAAIVVELKQWEDAVVSDVEDCVLTWLGGRERETLHPSAQVAQYGQYLRDVHTAFQGSDAIDLDTCAYLHNAQRRKGAALLDPRYRSAIDRAPLYFGSDVDDLVDFLVDRVRDGDEGALLSRVTEGRFRPSRSLMNHVADMIEGSPVYTLLDEQLVVTNSVLRRVQRAYHEGGKAVVLVKGGPGTGKSVIAAHLVARLNRLGYATQHATGSKAFTENLRKAVGRRAREAFKYFNNYVHVDEDGLDVLVCDEAHRIRSTSNHRFTRKDRRSTRTQIEELVRASRVSVFLLDDLQVVRPLEVGSSDLIRKEAARTGAELVEYDLEAQFRCQGSEAYVNWIDNTLDIRRTPEVIWDHSQPMDFQIMRSVEELESRILEKHDQGFSARLVAGYCWPWSKERAPGGQLHDDVVIGSWKRPWNARPDMTRLAPGIPKANHWATDPAGIDQVGCVYTAQGFEFEYVGVIFGTDLRYDPTTAQWIGDPSRSHDSVVKRSKKAFLQLVKQTYRVLLTRGMKGCYVYFLDRDTEAFVRSRMEGGSGRVEAEGVPELAVRVAEGPDPALGLSKFARIVEPVLREDPSLREMAEDEIQGLATDIGYLFERDDLVDWVRDAGKEERLRGALRRLLGSETLVDTVVETVKRFS